jgi:Bap31/Bap29 transmembrane region
MASLVWHGMFILLVLELVVTLNLVLPVPRRIRNWICRKILAYPSVKTKEHIQLPIIFLGLGLFIALVDCWSTLNYMELRLEREDEEYFRLHGERAPPPHAHHVRAYHQAHREKEYKMERNLYLTAFTLTLLLVIVRVLDLMQEHVQLEDEWEQIKQESQANATTTTSTNITAATTTTGITTTTRRKDNLIVDDLSSGAQIKMTALRKKPLEKKRLALSFVSRRGGKLCFSRCVKDFNMVLADLGRKKLYNGRCLIQNSFTWMIAKPTSTRKTCVP